MTAPRAGRPSLSAMGTDPALAEYLPVLYRVALDAIDELARCGGRTEAARLRIERPAVPTAGPGTTAADGSSRATIVDAHVAAGTPAPTLPLPGFDQPRLRLTRPRLRLGCRS